jgi:hypothetical protein
VIGGRTAPSGRGWIDLRHWMIGGLISFIGAILLAGCGSDGSSPTSRSIAHYTLPPAPVLKEIGPRAMSESEGRLKAAVWTLSDTPHGRRLSIATQQDHCVGDKPPRLKGVHVDEHRERVYITAYVERTRPTAHRVNCLGFEGFQRGVVQLQRRAGGRPIFDRTPSPPALRWPVSGAVRPLDG